MPESPIQTQFDGGEVSPRLGGRFDSPLYKKALKQCSDFEPLAQGSLRMRAGTVNEIKSTGDTRIRLLRLRVSNGDDYLIELLDQKMNVYLLNGTQLQPGQGGTGQGGQIDVIANGDFTGPDGNGWKVKTFGSAQGVGVYFTDSTQPDPNTGLPTQLGFAQLVNNLNSVAILYQKVVVPFASEISISASLLFPTANDVQLKISTTDPATWVDADHGGEAYVTDWDLVADAINPAGPFTAVNRGPLNLAAGVYYVSFQIEQRAGPVTALVDNVVVVAKYAIGSGVVPSSIETPWTANEVADLQFDTETGRDRTIFCHDQHAPWFLEYGGVVGAWSTGNVVFSPIPKDWGDTGSVNVDVGWNWQGVGGKLAAPNWPKCVQVCYGRIIYAGEPAQKNRVVGSKVNDPDNMTIGINPGDALDFKIATKGAIRWLSCFRKLLVGTDQGGYEITGSTGIPLVGDIQVIPQSGLQAASIQPVIADTKAVFVSSDFRRIRATTFDFQTQGWESKDVTFMAEHLTKGLIKELHQGYTPDGILVGLLQDGSLIACTFDAQEQIEAWWTINVGAPVCSACIAQGDFGAYLWLAVNRNGGVYIERLPLSESGEETLNYVDAGLSVVASDYISADGGDGWRVTGLNHLAGLVARVIDQTNGGVYVGDFGVGHDGEIRYELQPGEQQRAGNTLVIGIKYTATAVTMPKNSKSGKVSSSKLGVILNNSRQPLIGTKTLKRAPERTPGAPVNLIEPLFTGKKVVANVGWSDNDSITIQQDQPFRTEVCALFSITEVNEA